MLLLFKIVVINIFPKYLLCVKTKKTNALKTGSFCSVVLGSSKA